MYVAPLSPVLEESLKRSEERCVAILHSADATSLKYVLTEKVIDALLQNETVLIVVDDQEDIAIPAKLLSVHKIGHLCLIWNDDEALGPKQLERMQILKDLVPLELKLGEYDLTRLYKESLQNQIQNLYSYLHRPVLGEWSLKDVIQNRKGDTKDPGNGLLDATNNPAQINNLLQSLGELEDAWEPHFATWQNLNLFHPICFKSREDIFVLRERVASLFSSAQGLLGRINLVLSGTQDRIRQKIWKEYHTWVEQVDQLIGLYYSNSTDQKFALWDEAVQGILSNFRKTEFLRFDDLGISYFDWDQTLDQVEKIRDYLSSHNRIVRKLSSEHRKRMTPFNTDDPDLLVLVDQVKKFLSEVNDTRFFKWHFETEVLLIEELQQRLTEINKRLSLASSVLDDQDYVSFKVLQVHSGVTEQMLDYMVHSDTTHWTETYLQVIFNRTADTLYDPSFAKMGEKLAQCDKIIEDHRELILKEIHNRWCKKKEDGLYNLKKLNPDLYKILFETRETTLSINNLLFNDPGFIQSFYPLLCVRMNDLRQVLKNDKAVWNHIFFLNTKAPHEDLMPYHQSNIFIATSLDLPVDEMMQNLPVKYFFSGESRPDYTRNFSLLSRSEKYAQAFQLASCIMSVSGQFSVFHLKNECFISFLNEELHGKLISLLPRDGFNLMYDERSDMETLVEALVSPDSSVHLCIENHLLNDKNYSSIEWQKAILKWIENAGLRIHNFTTHDLYRSPESYLLKMSSEMTPAHTIEVEDMEETHAQAEQ